MQKIIPSFLLASLVGIALFTSCDEQSVKRGESAFQEPVDSTKSKILNIAGKMFSVPSPIQTAQLIRDSKSPYRRDQLSDPSRIPGFAGKYDKAINMGILGTDMAYASLFEDGQSAVRMFKGVEDLANALEIKGAIDKNLLRRLSENLETPDSLILLSSKFYQQADEYLKNNSRADVAAAVLAGGWLEATHLTIVAAKSNNPAVRTRLAEQRFVVETVIEVMNETMDPEFKTSEIYKLFTDLEKTFKGVTYTYTYTPPKTDPTRKRTEITSVATYSISDSLFNEIANKTDLLRDKITQEP